MQKENNKTSRENILKNSLNVFGKLGFTRTTMSDIAEAAKRGRRTIYMYFQNKEEIFSEVVSEESNRILKELETDSLKDEFSFEEKIKAFVKSRNRLIIDLLKSREALKEFYLRDYNLVEKVRVILDKGEVEILVRILKNNKNSSYSKNYYSMATSIQQILKSLEFQIVKTSFNNDNSKQINSIISILLYGITEKLEKEKTCI